MEFEKFGNHIEHPKVTIGPLDFAKSDVFWTLTILLRKLRNEKPEIYQAFKEKVKNTLLEEIGSDYFNAQIEKVDSNLVQYDNLIEESEFVRLHLSFMIKTLRISPEELWENKTTSFSTKDFMPSSFGLFYIQVKALIDFLGRDNALQFFREFQDSFNEEVNAIYQKDRYESLEHMRTDLENWLPRNPYGRNKIMSIVRNGQLIEICLNCEKYDSMKASKYGNDDEILYTIMCYMHKPLVKVWNDNFRLELDKSLALKNKFCTYVYYDKRDDKAAKPPRDEFLEKIWAKYK